MTSIGLEVLNQFSRFLQDSSAKKKAVFSDRELAILSVKYDWEEYYEKQEASLPLKFNITRERVRQIAVRALKKVVRVKYPGFDPVGRIRNILKGYALPGEQHELGKTIVRFCVREMDGLPLSKMVVLLANLCLRDKNKVKATLLYFKANQKELSYAYRKELQLAWKANQRDTRFNEFLNTYVIWFDHVKRWREEHFYDKKPKRTVVADERFRSGTIYSRKSKRMVQYESGAELNFIRALEASSTVAYYLDQPVTITYERKGKQLTYTPDFAVLLADGRCFFAEVKANFHDLMDTRLHRSMEKLMNFCQEHGFGLLLSVGSRSFDYIAQQPIHTGLETAIREKLVLGRRTIFLNEFEQIISQVGAKKIDALAVILKNNWGYYPFPFKLTSRNPYGTFRKLVIEQIMKNVKGAYQAYSSW